MDKRSSLLRKFVNYGEKKFYEIGTSSATSVCTANTVDGSDFKSGAASKLFITITSDPFIETT